MISPPDVAQVSEILKTLGEANINIIQTWLGIIKS